MKGLDNPLRGFMLMFMLVFSLSCTHSKPTASGNHPSLQWQENDSGPKTVVIMPFENQTTEGEIVTLVRESFYSQFCAKNYRDVELGEVDQTLKMHEQRTYQTWKDLSPKSIGDIFNADFVIYGKVHAYKKYFLGIYAQIALEVSIEMVESRSGDGVWLKTLTKRSHEGGVPFDLFGVVPA
ncbi:MAG: DUF799 family lipoprotein, partial [Deltaproteobacteria bacterium]|nr:DUF799 family lipoprotein [Deltaproteobacteria bacterium]